MITIIVPVLNRPHRVAPFIGSLRRAIADLPVEYLFVANESDTEEIAAIRGTRSNLLVVPDAQISWANKINRGFAYTTTPWILCGSDDIELADGWFAAAKPFLAWSGVLGTSSTLAGGPREKHSTHPLVSRSYIDEMGTFDEPRRVVHSGYRHHCPDTELCETAIVRGRWKRALSCVVTHLRDRMPVDSTYMLGRQAQMADRAIFLRRMGLLYATYGCPDRMRLMRGWLGLPTVEVPPRSPTVSWLEERRQQLTRKARR